MILDGLSHKNEFCSRMKSILHSDDIKSTGNT